MCLNKGLLNSHPFFESLEQSLLVSLVSALKPLRVEKGSIIYRRNDRANYIYFLFEGKIDFFLEFLRIVYKSMIPGSYFGDYEVIHRIDRQHTTRAKVDSSILTLSKEAYNDIIFADYPDVARKMTLEAGRKLRRTDRCRKVAINNAKRLMMKRNELAVMDMMRKENIHTSQYFSHSPLPKIAIGWMSTYPNRLPTP